MKKFLKIFTIVLPLLLMLFITTPKTHGYINSSFTKIGSDYYYNWNGLHHSATPMTSGMAQDYSIQNNTTFNVPIPSEYRSDAEYYYNGTWQKFSNYIYAEDLQIIVNQGEFFLHHNGVQPTYIFEQHDKAHVRIKLSDDVPVLDGNTAFVTDIDNPISVSTITSYISAYDDLDGDLTHAIEMVDSARDGFIYELINWHNNELIDLEAFGGIDFILDLYDEDDLESLNFEFQGQILSRTIIDAIFAFQSEGMYFNFDDNLLAPDDGYWWLYYYVIDSSGNGSILRVTVLVKDITAPSWNTSKGSATIGYSQTFNVETYKSQLGVSDNYYPSNQLTITVHSNAYTSNKTIPGTYNIVYRITDPSGNYTDATVAVTVIDDVAPVISGPLTITKPASSILLLSEIKAQLTANDAVSGNLTSSIVVTQDNYTGKGHQPGNYTITFSVTDGAGNTATHTITIQVKDNMPPIFYVKDGYFINVSQGITLTRQQIIDILILTGQLNQSGQGGMHVQTTLDEYSGNEQTPGIYAMSFFVTSPSGSESTHHVAINVMSGEDDGDPIIITDPNWLDDNKTLLIVLGVVAGIAVVVALNSKPRRRR